METGGAARLGVDRVTLGVTVGVATREPAYGEPDQNGHEGDQDVAEDVGPGARHFPGEELLTLDGGGRLGAAGGGLSGGAGGGSADPQGRRPPGGEGPPSHTAARHPGAPAPSHGTPLRTH